MIDTDKYEGTVWDLKGQFRHDEMASEVLLLVAEVKRLREIEREWKQMWSKLEDYPDICAELICFMESEEE